VRGIVYLDASCNEFRRSVAFFECDLEVCTEGDANEEGSGQNFGSKC
jgi:hypothetical protein